VITIVICDFCGIALPIRAVDKSEWDHRHAHYDEQEGGE
jgi:hypothetical protein